MEFILLALAHFLALLSPGPDFFLILQASIRLPFRFSLLLCLGIAAANGVYLGFAILGLELVSQAGLIQQGLKYLGGAYLVFIGIMLLRSGERSLQEGARDNNNFLHEKSYIKQFYLGFLSGILNPKNAIFYLAIFSTMVSPETSFTTRTLYGLWMVAVVFTWDGAVAFFLGNERVKQKLGEGLYYIEKLSGAVLAAFGLLLSLS